MTKEESRTQIFRLASSLPDINQTIHRLLDEIPKDEQVMIHKRFWENKSLEEISEEMGIRMSSLEKKINSAFEYLKMKITRKVLEEMDENDELT